MKETIIRYTCDGCGLEMSTPVATVVIKVAEKLISMPFYGEGAPYTCSHDLDGTYDLCAGCLHKVAKDLNLG